MKIGYISQWYPPERGSAALPGTITTALAGLGHHVEVVTAFPNYPDGELQPGWRQRWSHTESVHEVIVHRTPVYVSHDHRASRRMVNYISFALSATISSVRRLRGVDVVWVHGTPVLPALPALVLRHVFRIPFVLHVQDLWPDTVFASGMLPKSAEPVIRTPLNLFCRMAYASASTVGVIAPGMRQVLRERGVPEDKIADIPNWADESIFRPTDDSARGELGLSDGFVSMYAGALGDVQGLETLVQAAARLSHRDDIQVAVVGDGVSRQRLEELAERLGARNIVFLGPRPLSEMTRVLASADLQVICLKDLPLYQITLPSKVQAILAAACPVVVSAGGDAGAVVEEAGAGLAVPPGDPDALATAIQTVADMGAEKRCRMGAAGRAHYETHFSEASGVSRMVDAMSRAVARTPRRRKASG